MEMHSTHCCAIAEIHNLATHGTPEDAMIAFCTMNLSGKVKFKGYAAKPDKLYSFYLFTAAVEEEEQDNVTNYGHRFRALIVADGLGTVWESPARTNEAYHPDHPNQVWVWMPDVKALRTWYNAKTAKPVPTTTKPGQPTAGGGDAPF